MIKDQRGFSSKWKSLPETQHLERRPPAAWQPVLKPLPKASLGTLPTELLLQIFNHLVIVPPTLRPRADQNFSKWSVLWSRRALFNLSLVSRHTSRIATLSLWRVLYLTQPLQLVSIWRQIRQYPELASSVYHIICEVELTDPDVIKTLREHHVLSNPRFVLDRAEITRMQAEESLFWPELACITRPKSVPQLLLADIANYCRHLETMSLNLSERLTGPEFRTADYQKRDFSYRTMTEEIAYLAKKTPRPIANPVEIFPNLTQLRLQIKPGISLAPNRWILQPLLHLQRLEVVGRFEHTRYDFEPPRSDATSQLLARIIRIHFICPKAKGLIYLFNGPVSPIRSIRFDMPDPDPSEDDIAIWRFHRQLNIMLPRYAKTLEHLDLEWMNPEKEALQYYFGLESHLACLSSLRKLQTLTVSLHLLFRSFSHLHHTVAGSGSGPTETDLMEKFVDDLPDSLTRITIREWWIPGQGTHRNREKCLYVYMLRLAQFWLMGAAPGARTLQLRPWDFDRWMKSADGHKGIMNPINPRGSLAASSWVEDGEGRVEYTRLADEKKTALGQIEEVLIGKSPVA